MSILKKIHFYFYIIFFSSSMLSYSQISIEGLKPREYGFYLMGGYTGSIYTLSQYGIHASIGYKKYAWWFGLRGRFIETEFNNIFTRAESDATSRTTEIGYNEEKSIIWNSSSEYNRIRNSDDRWRIMVLQPMVTHSGPFYPSWFPNLMRRIGFGLGAGFYSDKAHDLNLKGYLVTTEAGVYYPLFSNRKVYIDLGVDFNFGHAWKAQDSARPNEAIELRQIPVYFFTTALSLTWLL